MGASIHWRRGAVEQHEIVVDTCSKQFNVHPQTATLISHSELEHMLARHGRRQHETGKGKQVQQSQQPTTQVPEESGAGKLQVFAAAYVRLGPRLRGLTLQLGQDFLYSRC